MHLKRLLLWGFFCFVGSSVWAQQLIKEQDVIANGSLNISGSIKYLGENNEAPIDSMLKRNDNKWISNNGSFVFHQPNRNQVYWIRFQILCSKKTGKSPIYLQLSNRGINETELFILRGKSYERSGTTGDHYPFYQRPLPLAEFTFPISTRSAASDTITCLLYCDKRNENLTMRLHLVSEPTLKRQEADSQIFTGLFCGILIMALFVSLILLIIFRDKLNFWYALYICSIINMLLVYDGADFQWFYPNWPSYVNISRFIASSITVSLLMYVMQLFCNQQPSNSRFYYPVTIFRLTLLLMVPYTFIVYQYFPNQTTKTIHFYLFLMGQTLGIILVIISTFEKMRQLYKPAYFYFSAVMLLLYSGVNAILLELGVINRSAQTPNLLQWSFVVEVILISGGILYKYQLVKKENDHLSNELTDLKLSSMKQMLSIQQEEQQRIAEDLHDIFGGQLAAAKFKLTAMSAPDDKKEEIIRILDDLSASSRTIAHNLLPAALNETDLSTVIRSYLTQINKEYKIHFEFIQVGVPPTFTQTIELSVYKIIIEIITNTIRHAQATQGMIQLSYSSDQLEIIAEDNGVGITHESKEGMGLRNIRKRVKLLSGNIHLDTRPGNTTFIIQIPLL